MVHEEWFERVSASVDGELDAAEEAALEAHLKECDSCSATRAELEDQRRRMRLHTPDDRKELVGSVLRVRQDERAEIERTRSVLVRRGGLAAAAVAAAVIALIAITWDVPATRPTPADDVLIAASNQSFDDPTVEIETGTTVEWRNDGSTKHHLVRKLGAATVGDDLAPGQVETATFSEPGTFEFFCTIHPEMEGTVTVDA